MKIDDYLRSHHTQVPFEAVIEPVADDPARIRILPVRTGAGCLCDRALVLDKDCVAEVEPTSRTVTCCGKLRRVVAVTLREDARVPALDVVTDLLRAGPAEQLREPGWGVDPEDPRACQEEAIWRFKQCVNSCRNAANPDACREKCQRRLQRELAICYGE